MTNVNSFTAYQIPVYDDFERMTTQWLETFGPQAMGQTVEQAAYYYEIVRPRLCWELYLGHIASSDVNILLGEN